MSEIDLRDRILQQSAPVLVVPRFSKWQPLQTAGHRFLVAADGLWLELRRPWLYLRTPLARQHHVAMPYGTVKACALLGCGELPRTLINEFVVAARKACPMETAATVLWNSETEEIRLAYPEVREATIGSVEFSRVRPDEHEHVIVDLHSHGKLPAFFSAQDDQDDAGDCKIAGVIGNCDGIISEAWRLCALGLIIPFGETNAGSPH